MHPLLDNFFWGVGGGGHVPLFKVAKRVLVLFAWLLFDDVDKGAIGSGSCLSGCSRLVLRFRS